MHCLHSWYLPVTLRSSYLRYGSPYLATGTRLPRLARRLPKASRRKSRSLVPLCLWSCEPECLPLEWKHLPLRTSYRPLREGNCYPRRIIRSLKHNPVPTERERYTVNSCYSSRNWTWSSPSESYISCKCLCYTSSLYLDTCWNHARYSTESDCIYCSRTFRDLLPLWETPWY
jgi:hypothetical protein